MITVTATFGLLALFVALATAHDLAERRGQDRLIALKVAKVINCTGPRSDYSKFQHPLLVELLANRLIDHDPLALGIDADPRVER